MANQYTTSTSQPELDIELAGRKRLSKEQWSDLSTSLMISVQAALSDREPLEQNLVSYIEGYEMMTQERNWPYENAANIVTPLTVNQLDSLVAYITGQVLVPRLFMVTGVTPQAAQFDADVERYYNSELKRLRGSTTWFDELANWMLLATRDGTAYIECLWKYKSKKIKTNIWEDQMELGDDNVPKPVVGPDGLPVRTKREQEVEDIYNDVVWKCESLRNIITIPAAATSIDAAMAVIKVMYPYEDELRELINDGVLDEEEVEAALSFVPIGSTELVSSQQPTISYTAGGQLALGEGQGAQTSKFFRNRGPIEVYRVHSRQFDLDGDGEVEENVFWVHANSWRLLGWMRYEYFNGQRPFFPFSPFPRGDTMLGFSLIERLMGIQNEKDALRRQRLDEGALRLSPPFVVRKGSYEEDTDFAFGLNQKIELEGAEDLTRLQMQDLPQFGYMEEQILDKEAADFTGMSGPAMGGQSSSRRSATEARQRQAAIQTRTALIAMRFRMAIRPLINFTHQLKKQYLTTNQQYQVNGQQYQLPLQVLQQDFLIEVTGATDPVDNAARRTETLGAAQLMMQFPMVAQNPVHQYYLLRKVAETFDWPDMEKIIGTEQEVLKMVQAQEQAQQQQAQAGQPPAGGDPSQPGGAPAGPPQGGQSGPAMDMGGGGPPEEGIPS